MQENLQNLEIVSKRTSRKLNRSKVSKQRGWMGDKKSLGKGRKQYGHQTNGADLFAIKQKSLSSVQVLGKRDLCGET